MYNIIQNTIAFLIASGSITWLFKSLGRFYIDKRFKAYEKELDGKSQEYQSRLNANLETHKALLNIEHAQFTNLHEKRLEIMVEIYKKISDLDSKSIILTQIIKPIPDGMTMADLENDHMSAAYKSYSEFQVFYNENKIFFNVELCTILDNLRDLYWNSFWDRSSGQRLGVSDFKSVFKASEIIKKVIPPVKSTLENEFRTILGVK